MGFNVELLAFSENPIGDKLATFLVTLPRSILAEVNTHRVLSRNAASSRAIPTKTLISRILNDPYIPDWTVNGRGMSGKPMNATEAIIETEIWLEGRYKIIGIVLEMMTGYKFNSYQVKDYSSEEIADLIDNIQFVKPHKQDVNRLLEPYMFMEWIVSGTEWSNFFFQRCHVAAHPAFQEIAYRMARQYLTKIPRKLEWGEWHLPFVTEEDLNTIADLEATHDSAIVNHYAAELSAARCGRVSFGKHSWREIIEDLKWFTKHIHENAEKGEPQHCSPAEHPAIALAGKHGNFTGFKQLRKKISGENHTGWGIEELNAYERATGREVTEL